MDLQEVFSFVCGSAHRWAPGGEALPFCQRCTGLYVGGFIAALTYLWLRPRPTTRALWLHGGLLLLMLPFGYHWLPQDGVLRTATGFLFACGLVYFLSLTPMELAGLWRTPARGSVRGATAGLAVFLVLLLVAARWGGPAAAAAISAIGFAGLLLFLMFIMASSVLVPWSLVRAMR